jgi:neutral ceramidase
MSHVAKMSLLPCLLALLLPAALVGATLKAGVAKVDITPPPGLPMYGYFARAQLSTGTLDPLWARVLVLEAGEQRVALVTLDLGRTFGPSWLARLREAARKSSGIAFLLVTASHTHAGPNILDEYPGDKLPAWEAAALEKIAKTIDEASHRMSEARLGTGYGQVYIGYNRRRVNPDGTVTMLWQNPSKLPTAPIDPKVAVLRVDTVEGNPLAILVNYACHPVVFGPDNLQYSADFVGVMAKTVEQAFGGQPLCLFLQGGDGDINPYFATTRLEDGAVKWRDWTGEQLGQEAARVAQGIRTEAAAEPSLEFAEDLLAVRLRWNAKKFRQGLLDTYGPRIFEDHAGMLKGEWPQDEMPLAVTTLLINKKIALMGMPGEPFVELQINWRDRCPVPDAFFLGYANGYYDYFPTIRAAAEGGYGAADSDTYVELGAGERMVDHALTRVYEMLGRLTDMPEDLKK